MLQIGFREVGGNFRLYRVENGEQALAFLRQSGQYAHAPKPNLVLLNLNLPGLSGFDVLQSIKDDPALSDITAVVFSSSSLNHDKARCLAMGARSFVTKPADLDEFLTVLRNVCTVVLASSAA